MGVNDSTVLLKGAISGAVAWIAMDHTLRFMYDRTAAEVRQREAYERGQVPALERLAEYGAAAASASLSTTRRQRAGVVLQWTLGVGAGITYGLLRDRLPLSGLTRGLLYGAVFSLLIDELATPALKLTPGPADFPWQTHARGFAGHLVFGLAAELAMQTLEGRDVVARIVPPAP